MGTDHDATTIIIPLSIHKFIINDPGTERILLIMQQLRFQQGEDGYILWELIIINMIQTRHTDHSFDTNHAHGEFF